MKAITRISVVYVDSFPSIMLMMDPTITILNYMYCGDKYRAITRWLMGDPVSSDDVLYNNAVDAAIDAEFRGRCGCDVPEFDVASLKRELVYKAVD